METSHLHGGRCLTKGKGNETGKGQEKSRGKGREKGKNDKDNTWEKAPDKLSMKCFFCKEKGHARDDCRKVTIWLEAGHEPRAGAIEAGSWLLTSATAILSLVRKGNYAS